MIKKKAARRMVLKNEQEERWNNPSARRVARVIRELDTGGGNSFCRLARPGNNYVQALHGLNGWHLEWRETKWGDINDYRHYRASRLQGSRRKRLLRKSDIYVSRGEERDLLGTEEVVQCFLAFLQRQERPKSFRWRKLRI